MLRTLVGRLGRRHECRNTALELDAERKPGQQPQLIVRLIDECTGARYTTAFGLDTAEKVRLELDRQIDRARGL